MAMVGGEGNRRLFVGGIPRYRRRDEIFVSPSASQRSAMKE